MRARGQTGATLAGLAYITVGIGAVIPASAGVESTPVDRRPAAMTRAAFDQRIGTRLPLDAAFHDESGRVVRLGDYFDDTPVLLMPAYYRCPMLCGMVLDGLVRALRAVPFDVGRAFTVLTFSFDPEDTPAMAAAKKSALVAASRQPGAERGWHFLTGDEASIRRLTEAIGFRYAYDPASSQYAHASGVVVATPQGSVSHYFYGIEYAPRDLRLALVEASSNRLGSAADQLLLLCFRYDAATGRYSRVALGAMRVGGALTVLALGVFVTLLLRRDGRPGRQPALR